MPNPAQQQDEVARKILEALASDEVADVLVGSENSWRKTGGKNNYVMVACRHGGEKNSDRCKLCFSADGVYRSCTETFLQAITKSHGSHGDGNSGISSRRMAIFFVFCEKKKQKKVIRLVKQAARKRRSS